MFKGSLPALVTPFAEDGSLDEATFAAFVEWQIARGLARPGAGRHDRRKPDADA